MEATMMGIITIFNPREKRFESKLLGGLPGCEVGRGGRELLQAGDT